MTMQITKIGSGREFLAEGELQRLPSIQAVHQAARASTQYQFFNTMDLVNLLKAQNWLPVLAQEQRANLAERSGFQKHMIRFRQAGQVLTNVGDLATEMILTNAHDTTAAFVFMIGLFRFACLNGMIVSEGEFGAIRIPHRGFTKDDVIDASYKVIQDVPRLMDKVGEYRKIELKRDEQEAFAESALLLKFGDDEETRRNGSELIIGNPANSRSFSIPALLTPTRSQDMPTATLWNTFNTVQEKITKGNRFERTVKIQPNGRILHRNKVKGITGLNEDIRFNRGLWHLMEKMRELKS